MATTKDVKNQLANKANGSNNAPASPANTIAAYLKKMGPEIEKALPSHMNPDRMARIALTTIRTNPKLLEASVPSLLGAVMQAAQLGLEPGLIGHCYLVPFKNGKTGQTDVQFIIGYKGMIDLARRSGQIENIYAHAVYSKDEFDYELGLEPKLKHKPYMEGDRGEFVGAYAVAHFKDGGYQFEFMPKSEIDKRRKRSKAANNGPWVSDYEEMAKKTVIRHMWKYLPISVEIQQQAMQDEVVRKDVTAEPEYIDMEVSAIEDIPTEDVAEQTDEASSNQQEIEFE
ncbi:recombination and repair protein RecT [Bacillus methanolicus PB1]|uniref:Recombination and repair protein RecT n=1 Tax=Bacillus methanolicus PB1 TaxID=997296 RepID=I3DY41_BACMT|nr:recombination protein RecT [Bacillus methanolicus]EIJ79162.1 recombination and repair protein RecT [Bacillus methanolicus PB1]